MQPTHRKRAVDVTLIKVTDEFEGAEIRRTNGRLEVWNALHKSWIGFDDDDYINITTAGDHYPVSKSVVDSMFDKIEEL